MKICERDGCDKPVEPTKANRRHCSRECQERAWRDRNPRKTVRADQVDREGWITDEVTRVELIRHGHPLWRG